MVRPLLAAFLLTALLGCNKQKIAGQCAEASQLRCATQKICAPDRARGCQVCRCEAAWDPDHPGDPASPVLPPE